MTGAVATARTALRRADARSLAHARPGPLPVAAAVFLLAALALGLSHHAAKPAMSRAAALRALYASPQTGRALRLIDWTRSDVVPIDADTVHVDLYRGARLEFDAAVTRSGAVISWAPVVQRSVPYGSEIAYRTGLLAGLAAVFVLLAGVAPLRRMRNLDVGAMLALTAPVLLMQHGYIGASCLVAALLLGYLAVRCVHCAVAVAPQPAARPRQIALYDVVLRRLSARERDTVLRLLAVCAAGTLLMVALSSTGVDVIYAAMEGATAIIHGMLPYGHLSAGGVIHGDTYPILSYAAYTPLAAVAPVASTWDPVDLALATTALIALAGAACVARIPAPGRAARADGLRAGLSLLCFPPLLAIVSTGTTDVALGAILALAVVLWRRPAASASALAIAGWFKLAPFVLVPVWLAPLRGRRLLAAAGALAAISALCTALVIALGGLAGLSAMAHAVAYQFSRGSFQSLWNTLGAQAVQPYAQAGVLALVAGLTVTLHTRPELARDPRRMAALAAAVMIAAQLAANYWAFLYLAWTVPLIVASLLSTEAKDG
jgi:hypothetical protein